MQETIAVKLQIAHPLAGWRWFTQGINSLFKQPLALGGLFVVALAGVQVMLLIPLIGPFAWVLLSPAFSVAFMAAVGQANHGITPKMTLLLTAFKHSPQKTRSMLRLGAVYLLGTLLVALFTWVAFEGEMRQLVAHQLTQLGQTASSNSPLENASVTARTTATPPTFSGPESIELSEISTGLLIYMVLIAIVLTMLTWHAPSLVFWYNTPPLKALAFSAITCARNIGAMMVYFGSWALVMGAVALFGQWLEYDALLLPIQLLAGAGFSLSAHYTFTGSIVQSVSIP